MGHKIKKFFNKLATPGHSEWQYLDLLQEALEKGRRHGDRTGTGTRRLISRTMRFDLRGGKHPLLTTKKVHFKSALLEILWMLKGDTNVNWLEERGVRIWREWSAENGSLGPAYGKQFRRQTSSFYNAVTGQRVEAAKSDPFREFVEGIKQNPGSRRHLVSLWNHPEIPYMQLPPCHTIVMQATVMDGELILEMYQRSADLFLGVPFNISNLAVICRLVAKECGLEPGEIIWHGHDCHIYENHVGQVKEQLSRRPRPFPLLETKIEPGRLMDYLDNRVDGMDWEQVSESFELKGYRPHPAIKAKVSV